MTQLTETIDTAVLLQRAEIARTDRVGGLALLWIFVLGNTAGIVWLWVLTAGDGRGRDPSLRDAGVPRPHIHAERFAF